MASNNGVDAVRAIKEEVTFPPQSSRYKIYIIDEVHMLSISAFNALLKTIEEPPEYIIFIFATTELQKVPETIRSRCQQFHFQLISENNIVRCLKSAAEDLGIEAEEDALYWIAKEGKGSMRDSYTLFDQVASFSEGKITIKKIREKLGGAESQSIINILTYSFLGDAKSSIEELDSLFMKGISETQIIKDMSEFVRSLLFYKEGIRRRELLSFSEEDLEASGLSGYTKEMLELIQKSLFSLYRDIRYSINPRFELELLVSRISSIRFISDPVTIQKSIEEIKKSIESGKLEITKKVVPVVLPSQLEKKERHEEKKSPEVKRAGRAIELADIVNIISQKGGSGLFARTLSKVNEYSFADGILKLKVKGKFSYDSISKEKNAITKALAVLGYPDSQVQLELAEEEKKEYSDNIKAILKVFKGAETYITEEKKDEHKSIRNDEATGFARESDEQDEGGIEDT